MQSLQLGGIGTAADQNEEKPSMTPQIEDMDYVAEMEEEDNE
jgi:hypothetical protein